jgi:thioredoxin-related protein
LAKPVVDGLERELEGRAQVLRLSVMDDVGGGLAMRYGVRGVPTFVLLDRAGEVVLQQAGMPDRDAIQATVTELLGE